MAGGGGGTAGQPGGGPSPPPWTFGGNHSARQWAAKMSRRGWTEAQIDEAIGGGQKFPADNPVNPGNPPRPSDDGPVGRR